MRALRGIVAGAMVMVAAVVVSSTASASGVAGGHRPPAPPPAGVELAVSGAFTATGTLGSECVIFHQVVDGTGEWTALGASSFTLDFCLAADQGGNHYPVYDGTFTITAADGGTLTGDVGGYVEAGGPGPQFPLHFVLTVTGGTGRFTDATGSMAMEGSFGPAAFTAEGTVDGTVTLPPPTPSSWRDCLHGGWRNLVDHRGRPFHNLGHCLLWAVRHT